MVIVLFLDQSYNRNNQGYFPDGSPTASKKPRSDSNTSGSSCGSAGGYGGGSGGVGGFNNKQDCKYFLSQFLEKSISRYIYTVIIFRHDVKSVANMWREES